MFTKKTLKDYVEDNYNTEFTKMDISKKDKEILDLRRQLSKIHEAAQSALSQGNLSAIGINLVSLTLICLKIFAFYYMSP